jgi:AraC-like DNA-binding protein
MSNRASFQPNLCSGQHVKSSFVEDVLRTSAIYAECHQVHPRTSFHWQDGYEIHLTVEGRAQFGIGGRVFHQTPRQGLLFKATTPHQFVADPAYRFQRNVLCFVPERLALGFPADGLMALDWLGSAGCFEFRLGETDYGRVDELWRRLRLESHLQMHGMAEMCVALLVMILVILRRNPVEPAAPETGPTFARQRGDLVQHVLIYVQNHLADELSLVNVARLFRVSPEHLTRSFRRHLGVSFHQHVLAQRVTWAKDLLRESGTANVTDIAFAVGFQSSSHFNKVFKRRTGMTPTSFRGEGASA